MSKPIVSIKNISVTINSTQILRNNSLSVCEHELCAIVGPNGGGKTTLLKVLLGVIQPTDGSVEVLGMAPMRVRHLIGYVPQLSLSDLNFPIHAWDVVLMGLLAQKGLFSQITKADKEKALDALKQVGMDRFRSKPIGVLSGGERQRVFLARALVNDPQLLLLDEPTANIDPKMKSGIYELLYKLKKKTTIILVTHDMSIIGSDIDLLVCLNKGLHTHEEGHKIPHALEAVYQCPVDVLMQGLKKMK